MPFNPCFRLHLVVALVPLGIILTSLSAFAQTARLDHIRILVHDLTACQETFRNMLGFQGDPKPYVYPEGSAHSGTDLADGSYMELVGITDPAKLVTVRPWIVKFLKDHQGAHSVGFVVSSAKDKLEALKSKGIDVSLFNLGQTQLLTPKMAALPPGVIFFLEYPQARIDRRKSLPTPVQPNTATAILSMWMVVKDFKDASEQVEALGFRPTRFVSSRYLGAKGQEFEARQGMIVLLQPTDLRGLAAKFKNERGEGIMGFTIQVADSAQARKLIAHNTRRPLKLYSGFYGKSFLIPSDLACGVSIEMAQK